MSRPRRSPWPAPKDVTIRWLLGKDSPAPNFYLRLFEVQPGGHSPYHTHPSEHEIFILEGRGRINAKGRAFPVAAGSFALVEPNEEHQFENSGDDGAEIPLPGARAKNRNPAGISPAYSIFSTTMVILAARAAMAPTAASTGRKAAPTTPRVRGISIRVFPSSFFKMMLPDIALVDQFLYLLDHLAAVQLELLAGPFVFFIAHVHLLVLMLNGRSSRRMFPIIADCARNGERTARGKHLHGIGDLTNFSVTLTIRPRLIPLTYRPK